MPKYKFHNLTYKDAKKIRHNGVGHKSKENIVVHIVNMLDDSSHYKTVNGKLHVRDLNIRGGKIVKEKGYISIEEHNNKHYPKVRSPLKQKRRRIKYGSLLYEM